MLLKTGYRFESIEKFDGISDHSAMILRLVKLVKTLMKYRYMRRGCNLYFGVLGLAWVGSDGK